MNTRKQSRWRALWVVPPIILGIVVLVWLAGGKQPPAKAERGEPTHTVRVIEVPLLDLVPIAEGYGPVVPARVWAAVSQVKGRVVQIHPRLRDGEILPEGTLLLRIDPVDYELALAQARAELGSLEVQEQNARASLDIEERGLLLARQDLERKRKLVGQGTTSESVVDEAERAMLGARRSVQNLENTLALIPAQRQLLDAKAARAERDLEHTGIQAPFNMRVANLAVEADQFVTTGQTLFEGDAVDRVEIEAQMAMSSLRRLFIGRADIKVDFARLTSRLPELLGFKPLVRLDLGNHVAEWEAELVRFGDEVDARTRTMGVVVAVDRPFEKIIPGYRPPLSKGMFIQVVLRGKSQTPRLVVPRSAVRGGAVYVADQENRLRRRPVEVLFNQGRLSVIAKGLEPGELVLVSDLVPVVEGMLLQPEVDDDLTASLQAISVPGDGL